MERGDVWKVAPATANITIDVLGETSVAMSALPLRHGDLDHPERAKNPALIRNIKSDGIRFDECQRDRAQPAAKLALPHPLRQTPPQRSRGPTHMHDLVIRGGTIVDGTGAAKYTGDLAIDAGTITQVGGKAGPAKREIDAQGQLVTPGWVDIHTHYDGQATWDPVLAPSSWHGATTILMGNCGVGFAPVRKADHDVLIDLMEGVEDIPALPWPRACSGTGNPSPTTSTRSTASPAPSTSPPRCRTPPPRLCHGRPGGAPRIRHRHRYRAMAKLTEEAMKAGAFGFTTSRTEQHKTTKGELVPGRFAENQELYASAPRSAAPARAPSGCCPISMTRTPNSTG